MTSMLVLAVIAGLLLLTGLAYQAIGTMRDERRFPAPGQFAEAGGERLHLLVRGSGTPAVILEAGIAASSLSWSHVQPRVAEFTQTVSYDRAGLGWSAAARAPRTAGRAVTELRAALRSAGIAPPYVLAGHSFGGCVARLFAAQHPEEVAGLVLVDALDPREWLEPDAERRRMLKGGVLFSYLGAFLARIGVTRLCLDLLTSGRTWFPRLFVRSMGSGVSGVAGRIAGEVRKLPLQVHGIVKAHWCRPKCYHSMASHVWNLPVSSAEAAATDSLGDLPLVVLSGGHLAEPELLRQQKMSRLSSRGTHRQARQSGHWIHLDEPELVVEAIREVVGQARSGMAAGAHYRA